MMRYKPMLAYPVSAKPIDYNKPTFIQPKLDGVRCVIQYEIPYGTFEEFNGSGKVVAYSRTGKEWKNIDHILEELAPFFEKYPDVVLDGELYNHDLRDNFEKIISLVRKTKPSDGDRLEASKKTQFHCYDVIFEDKNVPYERRRGFLGDHLYYGYKSVNIIDNQIVNNDEEAQAYHKINLNKGYEGSIVRTNDPYQCKRSHNLRKFKDFHDAEAKIIGWAEGKGKRIGTIGKFIAVDDEGNLFGMPVMDKFKYLQDNFKKMQGYIDKKATFTYFERTKAGSYRHPLFKAIRNYE